MDFLTNSSQSCIGEPENAYDGLTVKDKPSAVRDDPMRAKLKCMNRS